MIHNVKHYIGILSILLFAGSVLIGGHLINGYSHLSQFISEIYAKGTEYGLHLRLFGFIPSGVLILWFAFSVEHIVSKHLKESLIKVGLIGFGLTYGLFTTLVSIFICDVGCEGNESLNQILHNIIGLLTYLFTPIFILLIGKGLSKKHKSKPLYKSFLWLGYICTGSVATFFVFYDSQYVGMLQRLTEALFLMTILLFYPLIKQVKESSNPNRP